MLILNIGGEGEVPGAINVNTFEFLIRPYAAIIRRGPFIGGDFTNLPIKDETIDLVVGNMLALRGDMAARAMAEAFRVLVGGGSVRAYAASGGAMVLLEPMQRAGFAMVGIAGLHAIGVKP